MRIENARIKSSFLGIDHGQLTAYLQIEWDGLNCSFGGYILDEYCEQEQIRKGHAFGSIFIRSVLDTLEVESWEKLPGTYLRTVDIGSSERISRIGHIIKDKWFDPKALSAKYKDQ